MRSRWLVCLLFMIPALASAEVEAPAQWVVWAEDGPEEVPGLVGADIDQVRVAGDAQGLHLRLNTFESPIGSVMARSSVAFDAVQGSRMDIEVTWVDDAATVTVDGSPVDGWEASRASNSLDWHIVITWFALGVDGDKSFELVALDAWVRNNGADDQATGPDLEFTPTNGGLVASALSLAPGLTIEGPDFAGGASVTVDDAGRPVVAYYVYDDSRGADAGIYIAAVDAAAEAFVPEWVAATSITREHGRDRQMRTQIAHDGQESFVLFTHDPAVDNDEDGPGHLGTPDSVYVAARSDDGWRLEDPTPGGESDVGPEDVSDLAARAGRVVAAVPVGSEVWVVERTGPDSWSELARFADATNAKLALASDGTIHASFVVYGDEGGMRDGVLYYASEANGFEAEAFGENIDAGWEEPETDGSYAIAVGPADEVALLWNDGRSDRDREQRVALYDGVGWTQDYAPLVPSHGNPQFTMRLGYANDGTLIAASGYGGTDTMAARSALGSWTVHDLPRYDVWDMHVSGSGLAFFAYTQPHGGTTLALSTYALGGPAADPALVAAQDPAFSQPEGFQDIPGLGIIGLVVPVAMALRRR